MARNDQNGGEPAIRKVQFTGGSTYAVSLPKEWARAQDLSPGASLYLYSLDDRVVVAPTEPAANGRRTSIPAAALDPCAISRYVRAAYVGGADTIVVEADGTLTDESRRAAREAVTDLVGVGVARETEAVLEARSMLDASEVSLEQTLAQLRQLTLTMHREALEALLEDEEALAESVADRADTVDRLVALVGRQFHAALVDVSEVDRLGVDRASAFGHVRVARGLGRVADHAAAIASVATEQVVPPLGAVALDVETAADDVRDLLRTALGEEPRRTFTASRSLEATLRAVDSRLRDCRYPAAVEHARVTERYRQTATQCESIATGRLADADEDPRTD